MVRITVTSSDGSVAYDRRFVGHIEYQSVQIYLSGLLPMGKDYDLGDMLHKTAQQASLKLRRKHGSFSNKVRFDELYPITETLDA